MKIILLQTLHKLGAIGDIKDVKRGFACNYLIPNGIATYATPKNIKMLEVILEKARQEDKEKYDVAKTIFDRIDKKSVSLIRNTAEDGKLFGSVKPRDIADILGISRKAVIIDNPIKKSGLHNISVMLHAELIAHIELIIASSEEEINKIKARKEAENQEAITSEVN